MFVNKIYNRSCRLLYELKDIKISKKIVVIESDDWGSIRMPSPQIWQILLQEGYPVDKRPYERFDILESYDDVSSLFDVLIRHVDSRGKHPCITANMLMSNPDFEKIRKSGCKDYQYETIDVTYSRQKNGHMVLPLMRHGLKQGVFRPQYHGREHFNVEEWMVALQNRDETVMDAFRYGICGLPPKDNPQIGNQYMVALRSRTKERQFSVLKRVSEGLTMFERLWGYKSESFVAPCYTWNKDIERILADNGVKLIQTSRLAKQSDSGSVWFHYLGEKNSLGQIYSIRNCTFEPSTSLRDNDVLSCLNEVRKAFNEHKPAIISSHRINYVGGLDVNNRKKNLVSLDSLLNKIISEFPDVEFLSSEQLVGLLNHKI